MEKTCFTELCNSIIEAAGLDGCKSEEYIESALDVHEEGESYGITKKRRIYRAKGILSAEYFSGEIKLAMKLRLHAGGSYLDLVALYHVIGDFK